MRLKNKKILVLWLLGLTLVINFSFFQSNNFNDTNYSNEKKSYNYYTKTAAYWELTIPIEIDDAGSNNWTWAEGESWFGGGNGTIHNPYIIENVTIDVDSNYDFCIRVNNSNKYFIIRNCTVSKANVTGIALGNANNSKIIDNYAFNNSYVGIGLLDSYNNTISKNNVTGNLIGGIGLGNSSDNSILENTANFNLEYGIGLGDSDNNTISNNNVTQNGSNGIILSNTDGSTILENLVNGNLVAGISLISSDDNAISNNTANKNNKYGISLEYSDNNLVLNNIAVHNDYDGIRIYFSENTIVSNNVVSSNSGHGIYLYNSYDNTISQNSISSNDGSGISLRYSDYTYISFNTVTNHWHGIHLYGSDSNTITTNWINYNYVGIYLTSNSYYNFVSDNIFTGNDQDIYREQEEQGGGLVNPVYIAIGIGLVIICIIIAGMMTIKRKKLKSRVIITEKYSPYKIVSPEKSMREGVIESREESRLVIRSEEGELDVSQDELEVVSNISQLRSKYKDKIVEIREYILRKNKFISLEGIDEILILMEKLKGKAISEISDIFIEKLLNYAIRVSEDSNERLINDHHIRKANQMMQKIELDLMSRIPVIEEILDQEILSTPQEEPEWLERLEKEVVTSTLEEKLEVDEEIKEELLIPPPEEIPEEIEILKEDIAIAPQETLEKRESLEVVVSTTEEIPEEIVSLEPKEINCPFCAFKIDKEHRFCPQCGYILMK